MRPINLLDLENKGLKHFNDHPAVYFILKSDTIPNQNIDYSDISNYYDKLIYVGCSNTYYLNRTRTKHIKSFKNEKGPSTPVDFKEYARLNKNRVDNLWVVGYNVPKTGQERIKFLEDFKNKKKGVPACNNAKNISTNYCP